MTDIKHKKILMTLMRLEIGGAETHVLELSLELKRRGYDVVVASGGGVYEKPLEEAGIRHYRVPMYTKRPDKVLSSLAALRKIIRDENIEIVHAHGRIPAFLCGLLHPFMNFVFVTTAHWVFRTDKGFRYLSNWGEKVMAVSEDIKTYLMDNYGTDPCDISVTINGIDTNKFSPEADYSALLEEFSLQKDSKKIVYISRMDEDRALVAFHLAEIAPEIDKLCPGAEIVIVGNGNVYDKLSALTEEINARVGRRMVVLAGARTDIDKFAAMSDIFIGVSRSALEAMACAKPVIVAGNEGYLGIFDEDKLQVGIDTNFCCRGLAESTPELLLSDVKAVLAADEAQLDHWRAYSRKTICERYSVAKMAEDNERMYVEAVNATPLDAVISGYYGYGNSGDEALLGAMISALRDAKPKMKICVLSKNPKVTAKTHRVKSVNRYRFFAIRRAIKKSGLFISGGGSLLQDVTSSRSIRYYLHLIRTAIKVHTPVMLYANGIGPVTKEANRRKMAKVLSEVDCISLRENASAAELETLGFPMEKVYVTADPALSILPICDGEVDELLECLGVRENETIFGVSIRPWKNAGADFVKQLAEGLDAISRKHNMTPVFVPMKYPEDFEMSRRVASLMEVTPIIVPSAISAEETIGLISRMEVMVAERIHSLIYAANAKVPTIGLSYDTKVDAFTAYIGVGETVSLAEFSADILENSVDGLLKNREAIRADLEEKHAKLTELEKQNADFALKFFRAE